MSETVETFDCPNCGQRSERVSVATRPTIPELVEPTHRDQLVAMLEGAGVDYEEFPEDRCLHVNGEWMDRGGRRCMPFTFNDDGRLTGVEG